MDTTPAKRKSNDPDDLASRRSSRRRGPPKSPLDEDFVRPGQVQKTKAKKEECSTETTAPSSGADPTVALLEMAAIVKAREGEDTVGGAHEPPSMDIQPGGAGDGQVDKDAAGNEGTASKHPSNPSVSTGATGSSEGK